jgi:type VI protein secretion system component VasK
LFFFKRKEREERIKKLETLNNDLQREKQELHNQLYMEQKEQQCLQGKTNLKRLETEYNQLKQENAKLQLQQQHDAERNHQLCNEKKDLQEGYVRSCYFFKPSHVFTNIWFR